MEGGSQNQQNEEEGDDGELKKKKERLCECLKRRWTERSRETGAHETSALSCNTVLVRLRANKMNLNFGGRGEMGVCFDWERV